MTWANAAAFLGAIVSVGVIIGFFWRTARHVSRFVAAVNENTKAITQLAGKVEEFSKSTDGRMTHMETTLISHESRITALETPQH